MDNDSISNNSVRRRSFLQDAQGNWYSQISSSAPSVLSTTTTASMTSLSPTTTDRGIAAAAAVPVRSETISISSDDDESSQNQQGNRPEGATSILSQEWLPPAASTPLSPVIATTTVRSEREIESDLFNNIEQLVREFVNRPDRQYPYYRVMRWTTGEQPKIEHVVTVVINRPLIIL